MSTLPLESLPLDRLLKANDACNRFESALQEGAAARVDDFLTEVAAEDRPAVRRELDAILRERQEKIDGNPLIRFGSADAIPTEVHTLAPTRNRPVVAGYEVLGELGRGGMGVVYRARQLRPNRLVALKMISAGAHAGVRERERFRSEADAIAQLQHPHIVQIYEVGEQDGCPYLALEYVAGGSLDRHLAGRPQPPQAAAQLVERLAHAIHHAHERGIIHRDLKPANVLLQIADGKLQIEIEALVAPQSAISDLQSAIPKITDFGLAKLLGADAATPTQSGDRLGTPSYMAPEQVSSTPYPLSQAGDRGGVGPATDVYGLGAILYELLTGRPPFRAETALETMLQVQTVEPVSPSRLQPKCPRDLVTICLKCLSKQPHQRYASALELAEDLRRFQDGQPILARPVGPLGQVLKWTRRQPKVACLAGLLLLAVVLGVATGSWFWWQAELGLQATEAALGSERTARENERTALENERTAQAARMATLDRYQVALAQREWQANNRGRAQDLLEDCTPEQRQTWEWRFLDRMLHSALFTFTGHSNTVQAVAIHPSGRKIVSASHDGSVRLWDLDTGSGTVLGNHQFPALAVAFSPDGRLLASSGSREGLIKLWNPETGAEIPGLAFGEKTDVSIRTLAFDRESRYLAAGGLQRVKVWDTRDRKLVYSQAAHKGTITKVAFSPDGRLLATAYTSILVWDWKAKAKKPLYELPGHAAGTYDLAFSPNENLLATGGRDGLVRVHNLQTRKEEFIFDAHQLSVTSVCFSSDGERLASAGLEGDMHVWSMKERRRLFTLHGHSGAVWDLAYTPKDARLVSAGADFLVRVWDAATSQEAVTLDFRGGEEISAFAYSANGRLLAWGDIQGRAGVCDTVLGQEIHRVGTRKLKVRNPIVSIACSPDGRWVAWRRRSDAILWDRESGAQVPLVLGDQVNFLGIAFSADGKQLLAALLEDEVLQLHDLRAGRKLLALPRPGRKINQVVWCPDASCFATIEDRKYARVWATDTGLPLAEFDLHNLPACVTFSADGRFLAVGGIRGELRVWDVRAQRETMAVTGHSSRVYGLALSPDGRRLASTGADCTAKLWDTQTAHEVLTLRTQLHEHSPLAFSPDGADLASATMDNQIQIWTTRPRNAK